MSPVQTIAHPSPLPAPGVYGTAEVPTSSVRSSGIDLRCSAAPVRHVVLQKK